MREFDNITTEIEIDRRTWTYSNTNSVRFDEIENYIEEKMENVVVTVEGHYDPKNPNIRPYVVLDVANSFGYRRKMILEKQCCMGGYKDYCNYLINNIINSFAHAMFGREN